MADLAVVEGVMGLYDGLRGGGEEGSTAEVATLLEAPVILVIDVSGAVRSAGAMVMGFAAYDPQVRLAGVIACRVGGERHLAALRDALAPTGIPLLGGLPWDRRLTLPERHLGLIPAAEHDYETSINTLAEVIEHHIDLEAIMRLARQVPPVVVPGPACFPPIPAPTQVAIGVARDEAFSFYYEDALELLEWRGAQVVPFSPLHDHDLPSVDGLYLGGGFPEVHARGLSANGSMRGHVREAAANGMPIYAECGGMLYLAERLVDTGGQTHELVGLFPATVHMSGSLTLAYVTLEALEDTLLLWKGETVRGHEFHHSALTMVRPVPLTLASVEGKGIEDGRDGFTTPTLLATYAHVHFASHPPMVDRFIQRCRDYKDRQRETR
jgi:cobyrinic acid a,c-diamide synthase